MPNYIATVWIEHRHEPGNERERRVVVRQSAQTPIDFRVDVEAHYRRHYEPSIYDITVGVISESKSQQTIY